MSQPITQERIAFLREAYEHGCRTEAIGDELFDIIQRLRDELARRDAVRVEVPPVSALLLENLDRRCASYADMAERVNNWIGANARLVPAPPQADAVVVPREEWELHELLPTAARRFLDDPKGGDGDESFACDLGRILDDLDALRTSAQDHNDNETRG